MKLILSRKGFDSGAGGAPSPVLPDGTLLSLPIPSTDARRWRDLRAPDGQRVSEVMDQLGLVPRPGIGGCHLDPDLRGPALRRHRGWRPAFGSDGAAAGHLRRQGVGPGDLFLFFGWFRPAKLAGGRLAFRAGPDLHVVFGYLQVDGVLDPAVDPLPPWLAAHPHAAAARRRRPGNVIFTARRRLALPAPADLALPGAGTLSFADHRVLTAPGRSRSRWALPRRIFGDRAITYHGLDAWKDGYFQSAGRGQEFVLEPSAAVWRWVARILRPPEDGAP